MDGRRTGGGRAGRSVMRGDGLIGLVGDEEQWVMGDGWPADRLQG